MPRRRARSARLTNPPCRADEPAVPNGRARGAKHTNPCRRAEEPSSPGKEALGAEQTNTRVRAHGQRRTVEICARAGLPDLVSWGAACCASSECFMAVPQAEPRMILTHACSAIAVARRGDFRCTCAGCEAESLCVFGACAVFFAGST